MALDRAVPVLIAILVTTVVAMTMAARSGTIALSWMAAATAAIALLAFGILMNRPLWKLEPARVTAEAAPVAARRNAVLLALAYAWGATALLVVYPLSGLRWYHWNQYGAAMAIVALALAAYGDALRHRDSIFRTGPRQLAMLRLTVVHAMALAGGLGWLLLSGKIASVRDDWVANHVFVAGGVALVGLSVMAAISQNRIGGKISGS
ncbi:MAG: hypothetical protein ACOYLQ_07610 [Hyphomicrobiaceae bacterium]|jgi:hypothetical protein